MAAQVTHILPSICRLESGHKSDGPGEDEDDAAPDPRPEEVEKADFVVRRPEAVGVVGRHQNGLCSITQNYYGLCRYCVALSNRPLTMLPVIGNSYMPKWLLVTALPKRIEM